MNYPSIRIEGSIFSPDIIERLDEAVGQRPADFLFESNMKVKDEIAHAWVDAQDYWRIFKRKLETIKAGAAATTETRNNWVVPLFSLMGYQLEYKPKAVDLNGKTYAISHRVINRGGTPFHIIGYNEPAGLDKKPENATLRMSSHALVQEYLNLHEELYGLVSNGHVVRLLRDSSRLIKLSYVEFDLDRIFNDGLFADFAVLYRLFHASRLPISNETAAESLIEKYHQESLDSGARIRNGLSKAVEQAILSLGNGFLSNPENNAIREKLISSEGDLNNFYKSLLRLIYRILFIMVIEERNLVFPDGTPLKKREIYTKYYSIQRLRLLAEKRHLIGKNYNDLWLQLLSTFSLFESAGRGEKMGIKPLAGDLFGSNALGDLITCMLDNKSLATCIRSLCLYEHSDTRQLIRVNYAALNVEEFGSVYEGLLEYEPVIDNLNNPPVFSFKKGNEREVTGSHYTPEDLVQPLIKHSLEHLIADKLKEPDPEKALLGLRVADIACGSGHILLAAARKIATELAIVRTKEEQPSPSSYRSALRDVIKNCVYGVDINPLAVELCKVAFWLEAHNPGEPLNFLDHRVKCGDAIVGLANVDELQNGIVDEAFKPMYGDEKEFRADLAKQNKRDRISKKQTITAEMTEKLGKQLLNMSEVFDKFNSLPERTPEQILHKQREYEKLTSSRSWWDLKVVADIQIAQFFIPKIEANKDRIVTDAEYRMFLNGAKDLVGQKVAAAMAESVNRKFFHWFLEFPEIFAKGGFDCVLGNPPFLGNRKLKGSFGENYLNYINSYFNSAAVDLATYFFRRIFEITKNNGFQSLISTNTIAQGGARENGLAVILEKGGVINHAVRSMKWPGLAAVEVALVTIFKGSWQKKFYLDKKAVSQITSYLDDDVPLGDPFVLKQNENKSFQGSIVLGQGFVLEPEEAQKLIEQNSKNKEVLFPYLNGDDLNTNIDQSPSRWVINFFDWEEEYCRTNYPVCFKIVEERVKPERTRWKKDEKGNEIVGEYALRKPLPQKWWIYADKRPALYATIKPLERVLVVSQTSKTLAFEFTKSNKVLDAKLIVFAFDKFRYFSILQSTLHNRWAWKYCTTMKADLSYTPTAIFETFPFPQNISAELEAKLEQVGLAYHEFRKNLMQNLQLGLTKTYNQFHNEQLAEIENITDEREIEKKFGKETLYLFKHLNRTENTIPFNQAVSEIKKLRELHKQMDELVLSAYGWDKDTAEGKAINLAHDFYEVEYLPENDRVRYTISPEARKEILQRLLLLNHKIHAEEEKDGLHDKKKGANKKKNEDDLIQGRFFEKE